VGAAGGASRRRRRDRHDRGVRGPLAPRGAPLGRTRSQHFDDLVVDAFDRLSERLGDQLFGVEVLVEDVPPDEPRDAGGPIPLGRSEPGTRSRAARLVVYRRPIETRARPVRPRADLVHQVVVGLVADLLGMEPEEVDPDALGED